MANQTADPRVASTQKLLEDVLSRERFKGLKAILDCVCSDSQGLWQRVRGANSYEQLLLGLGFRLTLTRQIHLADCYSRVGSVGGIRAVLPYNDIPTQSSLPTLVNYDSTVTTTAKSAAFFSDLFAELKAQLRTQDQCP
jgi:hypothetical protein